MNVTIEVRIRPIFGNGTVLSERACNMAQFELCSNVADRGNG